MRILLFNFACILSFFNFLYIKIWIETSIMNPKNFFYIGGIPKKFILNNFFCFIVFFLFFYFFLKLSEKYKYFQNFLKFVLIIETSYIIKTFFPYKHLSILIFILLVALFTFIFIKFNFKKTLKFFGVVFFPLFILTIYNLYLLLFHLEPIKHKQFNTINKNQIISSNKKGNPIVWIVFDALILEKIHGNKDLKNFTKLIEVSDFYTNYKVRINNTAHSIPSILLGQDVTNFKTIYEDKKISRIFFDKKEEIVSINFDGSIFDKIKEKDKSIYINGWYFPYCKLINSYNECFANLYSWEVYSYNFNFLFLYNLYKLFPFRDFFLKKYIYEFNFEKFEFNEAIKSHKFSLKNFLKSLDEEFEFYFYHASFPHKPYIFNSDNNSYIKKYFNKSSYDENLVMTDLALGKIINVLKSNKKFEKTIIVISSDHPLVDDPNPSNNFKRPALIIKNKNQTHKKIINKEVYNFQLKNIVLDKMFNSKN